MGCLSITGYPWNNPLSVLILHFITWRNKGNCCNFQMGCYSIRGKNPEITLVVTYLVFYILKRQGLLLQLPIGMLLHQRKKPHGITPVVTYLAFYTLKIIGLLLQLPDGIFTPLGNNPLDNPYRCLSCISYLEKTRSIVTSLALDATVSCG